MSFATWPLWLSVLVVGSFTAASMVSSHFVRRRITLERLMSNNEVAGFKFATMGVIYAVLLGFAVIVVWEKYHDAEVAVAQEAGALVALYRLSNGLGTEGRAAAHAGIDAYVRDVVNGDWPAMAHGGLSERATQSLNNLYSAVLHDAPNRETAVLSEIFYQLDQVTASRRQRAVLCGGIVPGVIWVALFTGACITIGFTMFFGTRNPRAQMLMTGLLALMIFTVLMVIAAIDFPFTGEVSIKPEPFINALREFSGPAGMLPRG